MHRPILWSHFPLILKLLSKVSYLKDNSVILDVSNQNWGTDVMKTSQNLFLKLGTLMVAVLIFTGALYYANDGFASETPSGQSSHETARITRILEDNTSLTESGIIFGDMLVEIEILTGPHRGATQQSTYFLNQTANVHLEVGDRVSVRVSIFSGEIGSLQIEGLERKGTVLTFFLIFLVVLGLMGGKRGIMAIAGLVFALISIIYLLIPLMLKGYPVIFTTFAILTFVTIVSLVLLCGVTTKGISSMLGCLTGVGATALLTHIAGNLTNISGFNMEDIDMILSTTDFSQTEAAGLFISGVLIATLGAVMDTAVTIASAIEELKLANPYLSAKKLFKAGMNVGKDTMGTMSTTLILAFAGGSLNIMILIYSQGSSLNQLINSDFIVSEIIRGIAGSLGIILTIPAVAIISSVMSSTSKEK